MDFDVRLTQADWRKCRRILFYLGKCVHCSMYNVAKQKKLNALLCFSVESSRFTKALDANIQSWEIWGLHEDILSTENKNPNTSVSYAKLFLFLNWYLLFFTPAYIGFPSPCCFMWDAAHRLVTEESTGLSVFSFFQIYYAVKEDPFMWKLSLWNIQIPMSLTRTI